MRAVADVRVVPAPSPVPADPPEPPPAPGPEPGPAPAPAPAAPSAPAPGPAQTPTEDPGTSGPTVGRLGPTRVVTYSHAPPGVAPHTAPVPRLPAGAVGGVAGTMDVRQACCLVALAAVEVLAGIRPLAQLARWVTPDVYDGLGRRAALTVPGGPHLDPVAGSGTSPAGHRPSVRRVRVCPVTPHVVEATVVVAHAQRVRAVAIRLSRTSGRWRASALVIG